MFMVRPSIDNTKMPNRNEDGMARPTRPALLSPSAPTTTTMTRMMALMTLFCSSFSIMRISSALSWLKATSTPGGQLALSWATMRRTSSMVTMTFSPKRFLISSTTAGLPLRRA